MPRRYLILPKPTKLFIFTPYLFFMRFYRLPILFILGLIILFTTACKKNQLLDSGGSLRFSSDTLFFDTVFTTAGSATYKIKIYNEENQPVKVSSVRLERGGSSPFKLNVNGIAGNEVKDQELAPHDSMYVFGIVTIDPNSETSPFIVTDKLIATLNGKDFSVPVVAYGQNARYLVDSTIKYNATWDNTLPYVIVNNTLVDSGYTLTIQAGTRIYMHADSRLFIAGTLITNGTKEDSVIFLGDRLDRSYFSFLDLPGEWGGLYFSSNSRGSKMNWTIIKNAGKSTSLGGQFVQPAAIQIDQNPAISGAAAQLDMSNCIIQNSIGYGILSFGGSARVRNSMIQSCGAQNLGVFLGGNFEFDRCTFATYGTRFLSHADAPVMSLLNYFDTSNTKYIPGDLKIKISNSIIYGPMKDELICNAKGSGLFDVVFDHCMIKAQTALHPAVVLTACKLNEDPQFTDYTKFDFHLKDGSPAINAGNGMSSGPNLDNQLNNNIGAF